MKKTMTIEKVENGYVLETADNRRFIARSEYEVADAVTRAFLEGDKDVDNI